MADSDYQLQQARQEAVEMLATVTEGESVAKLLAETTEAREAMEKRLRDDISEYFQNMRVCETLAERCEANVKGMQTNLKDLDNSTKQFAWAKTPSLEKLVVLRKNLNQVVDTLHDFLNVSSQMKDLREQIKDYRSYENVHRKLLTICTLRDSMMSRATTNKKLEKTFKNFSEKFKEIRALEEQFYDTIFENIAVSIDLGKSDPRKLAKSLKVVELADLTAKQPGAYFQRAQQALTRMVRQRFESRLGEEDSNDIGSKLEAAKYSVDDLADVHQHLVPIFPEKYRVFDFVRGEYRALIESLVTPYLADLEGLKEDPGVILYFAGWLDNYEYLLKRVGVEAIDEYAGLREHVEKMMKSWIRKMLQTNAEDNQYAKVEAKAEEQEPLETQFPEDLFSLFNQQVTILGQKLKGEMFINVVRIWMNYLQDMLEEKAETFLKTTPSTQILRYLVEVNDFNKLALNLNDNKAEIIQYVEGDLVEKVNQSFIETAKVIGRCTEWLLEGLVKVTFAKIEQSVIEILFTPRWSEENDTLVEEIVSAISGNLQYLQEFLLNPVHSMRVLRYSAERFVHLYLERFIWYVKLVYGRDKALEKFQPVVYKPTMVAMKQRTPERQRLEDRLRTLKALTRDFDCFAAFVKEHDQSLSNTFASELLARMEVVANLERIEACDFVTSCAQYRKHDYFKQLVEAVVRIRKDVDLGALRLVSLAVEEAEEQEEG